MPHESARSDRFINLILMILLVASVVEVGLLIRQNRSLRAQLAEALSRRQAENGGPEVGSPALPLDVAGLDGAASRLEFGGDGRQTLVLVVSAECPACQETLPIWKGVLDKVPADKLRTVALTLEDPATTLEKLRSAGLDLPTFRVLPDQNSDKWKLNLVPITILVDSSGNVARVWTGVLSKEAASELTMAAG